MSKILIYNTLTKSKENFQPIKENEVGIYTCGPTVYNFVHIGNLRAYLFADILHRTFFYNGYSVKHIMNITDVDDKIIRDSVSAKESIKDFTQKYIEAFFQDMKKLNINIDEYIFPLATDNIDGMVALIKKLMDKGFAYKASDGSVYYDISKFKDYGKLSGVDFERDSQSRVNNDEYEKEEAHDFALWKAWDEKDGDVFWETELGKGRPGWHIECSVMSSANLGQPFDIHTGGIDLIFPHHENEIAQSEAANDKKFVNYWMHNEFLMVDSQRMGKSLGNVYSLSDIVGRDFSPLDFRYLTLGTHYRQKLNFIWEGMIGAQSSLKGLIDFVKRAKEKGNVSNEFKERFFEAINDDINTPKALAVTWEMLKSDLTEGDKLATVLDFDKVFGLGLDSIEKEIIPQEIIDLANERQKAKEQKDFYKADEIRGRITEAGYMVEDLAENKYKILKK
jgi:cysteinyl-tRNA synthetase